MICYYMQPALLTVLIKKQRRSAAVCNLKKGNDRLMPKREIGSGTPRSYTQGEVTSQ